jgi:phosphopantetheine adenylyltransferase
MAKNFRPSKRESRIISEIETSREKERRNSIYTVKENIETLSNNLAMKLVEHKLIETNNKDAIEEQMAGALEKLTRSDEFEIDYQIAPFRRLVSSPNIVSLYMTAFILEKLINHKDVEDIYGTDEEIYLCVDEQVSKNLAKKKSADDTVNSHVDKPVFKK